MQQIETVDVVKAVLKNAGFVFESLSSSGLAAERMVAQLGGLYGCDLFRHCGVREIFERLEGGQTLLADEIRATLHRLNRKGWRRPEAPEVIDDLVKKKALRPGMEFQCASCGRHEWYHISEFDENFECKRCFARQPSPRLEAQRWRYRADGLFTLDGKMAGVMSVLLSILHIRAWAHDLTYMLSFNYKDGLKKHEADLMCFTKGMFRDDVEVIVGEAKTLGSLDEHEIIRMGDLAKRLNAWLVFGKLGEFSESDKRHFRNLRDDLGLRLILLDRALLEAYHDEILDFKRGIGHHIRGDLARLSAFSTERIIGPPPDPVERMRSQRAAVVRLLQRWLEQREADAHPAHAR